MGGKRLKMFSPERISILLLVAAICAWAAVTMCKRTPDYIIPQPEAVIQTDSTDTSHKDTTIYIGKDYAGKDSKAKRNSSKKAKSKDPGTPHKAVPHRDHLSEPVPVYARPTE